MQWANHPSNESLYYAPSINNGALFTTSQLLHPSVQAVQERATGYVFEHVTIADTLHFASTFDFL